MNTLQSAAKNVAVAVAYKTPFLGDKLRKNDHEEMVKKTEHYFSVFYPRMYDEIKGIQQSLRAYWPNSGGRKVTQMIHLKKSYNPGSFRCKKELVGYWTSYQKLAGIIVLLEETQKSISENTALSKLRKHQLASTAIRLIDDANNGEFPMKCNSLNGFKRVLVEITVHYNIKTVEKNRNLQLDLASISVDVSALTIVEEEKIESLTDKAAVPLAHVVHAAKTIHWKNVGEPRKQALEDERCVRALELKKTASPYFFEFGDLYDDPDEAFEHSNTLFANHVKALDVIRENGVKLQTAWAYLPKVRDIQGLKRYFNKGQPEKKRGELMEIAGLWSNLIHAFRELDQEYGKIKQHDVVMPNVEDAIRQLQGEVLNYLPIGNGHCSSGFESVLHSLIDSFDYKNGSYSINRRSIQALNYNYSLQVIPEKRNQLQMQNLAPQYR